MKSINSICIIPARGGSKRIKNKNIKNFNGKPIIHYSLLAAKKTKLFQNIIVSSESKKIENVVKKIPKVNFIRRSKKLARDNSLLRPVIKDTLINFSKNNILPKYICYITATAPFIKYQEITNAYKILKKNNDINFVVSVTKFNYPILKSLRINKRGRINYWKKRYRYSLSNNIEEFYHDAGQFYWARSDAILKDLPTFSEKTLPYLLPNYRVIDIDDNEDWQKAIIMSKYL